MEDIFLLMVYADEAYGLWWWKWSNVEELDCVAGLTGVEKSRITSWWCS